MKHTSSLDSSLSTVRTEGGLLPADILAKILAGDGRIPGTTPEDYHLPKGEKLNESINAVSTSLYEIKQDLANGSIDTTSLQPDKIDRKSVV